MSLSRCHAVAVAAALMIALSVAPYGGARAAETGPSFDCSKATQPDEKAICADPLLADADRLSTEAYKDFTPSYDTPKREIGRMLAADRKACGDDRGCIAAVSSNQLSTYGTSPAWLDNYAAALLEWKANNRHKEKGDVDEPAPTKIGDCAMTTIKELGTRFGEPLGGADPGAGSAVVLTNGVSQLSYVVEDGLANSEVGQHVGICLMTVPRDCPKGDDRGKFYVTINFAANVFWVLPDSQHMCGGA